MTADDVYSGNEFPLLRDGGEGNLDLATSQEDLPVIHESSKASSGGPFLRDGEEANVDLLTSQRAPSSLQELRARLRLIFTDSWQGLNVDLDCAQPMLHEAARCALQMSQVLEHSNQHVSRFHVYTDGSAKAGVGAWAFVVLAEVPGPQGPEYARIGYACAKLDEDLGPVNHDSMDAEATGLIAAAEYILSRRIVPNMSISLHFDATVVALLHVGAKQCQQNMDVCHLVKLVQESWYRSFSNRVMCVHVISMLIQDIPLMRWWIVWQLQQDGGGCLLLPPSFVPDHCFNMIWRNGPG